MHFITGVFSAAIDKGRFDLQPFLETAGGLFSWLDKANWRFILSLHGDKYGLTGLEISAGGSTIFRVDIDPGNDPHKLTINLKPFGNTLACLADKHAERLNLRKKYHKIDCNIDFRKPFLLYQAGSETDFERDLEEIINTLLLDLSDQIITPFNLGADRVTIKNSALNLICSKTVFDETQILPENFFKAPVLDLGVPVDSRFDFMRRLAESSYLDSFAEKNPKIAANEPLSILQDPESSPVLTALNDLAYNLGFKLAGQSLGPHPLITESLLSFVNRCLVEHLFLDQGYQLVFEALEIKPATDIEFPPLAAALMIGSLVDKTGRRMMFEDIGTGISCVIPVLVSVHSVNSFIQQPELHLHPALQSALGDVFIEATKIRHSYHFIETHSEYILLRCLRRVRETAAGRHPSGSPLNLKPDDLSVLYFEPQSDGCTKVRSIRVSTKGDFIDRWPRGFFEERGKELFDE